MNNQDRAARLAHIPWAGKFATVFHVAMNNPESEQAAMVLNWLLREIPKRGFGYSLGVTGVDSRIRASVWDVKIVKAFGGVDADPLIALVDAVLAAHEGGAK